MSTLLEVSDAERDLILRGTRLLLTWAPWRAQGHDDLSITGLERLAAWLVHLRPTALSLHDADTAALVLEVASAAAPDQRDMWLLSSYARQLRMRRWIATHMPHLPMEVTR